MNKLVIATRASALALWQADFVRDEINTLVNERNTFKTGMEDMFKKELDMYNQFKNNPQPSTLENIMKRVADFTFLGTGGATLLHDVVGWKPAMVGGGMLAAQQGAKGIAKSIVKPGGMLQKKAVEIQTPFEIRAITEKMKKSKEKK